MLLYLLEKYFRGMALVVDLVPLCHPIAELYFSISRQIEIYRYFEQEFSEKEKNKNESN
jgi:hypothetical protein